MHTSTSGDEILRGIITDLQRQAHWAEIIPFLEQHSPDILLKKRQSPALYAKHKRWLLNTERLTIAQVLVFRRLTGQTPLSQGEFVRLLGGNPYCEGITAQEKREIQSHIQYWTNQIRNNIRPIMADYFGLMNIYWQEGEKPGGGEYSIQASDLLLEFFKTRLYAI